MEFALRVHRASTHPAEVPVQYNGETVRAIMPELEVELCDDSGMHGTTTLHFRAQAEIAEARALFTQGSQVMMTFTAMAPSAIETVAEEPAA